MARFTHDVCGRTFRSQRGLDTHVMCKPAQASAPKRKRARKAGKRDEALAKLTAEIMAETGVGYVRANIIARKRIAGASPEQAPKREPEHGKSPAKPHRSRARKAKPTSGKVANELTLVTHTDVQAQADAIVREAIAKLTSLLPQA